MPKLRRSWGVVAALSATIAIASAPAQSQSKPGSKEAGWKGDWKAFGEIVVATFEKDGAEAYKAFNQKFDGESVTWSGTVEQVRPPAGKTTGRLRLKMEPIPVPAVKGKTKGPTTIDRLDLRPTEAQWPAWEKAPVGSCVRFKTTLIGPKSDGFGVVLFIQVNDLEPDISVSTRGAEYSGPAGK